MENTREFLRTKEPEEKRAAQRGMKVYWFLPLPIVRIGVVGEIRGCARRFNWYELKKYPRKEFKKGESLWFGRQLINWHNRKLIAKNLIRFAVLRTNELLFDFFSFSRYTSFQVFEFSRKHFFLVFISTFVFRVTNKEIQMCYFKARLFIRLIFRKRIIFVYMQTMTNRFPL